MSDGDGNGLGRGGIGAASGLMYTAPERFASVSVGVREWTDLGVLDRAQRAWRDRLRLQGSLIAGMGQPGRGGKPSGVISGFAQYRRVKGDAGSVAFAG